MTGLRFALVTLPFAGMVASGDELTGPATPPGAPPAASDNADSAPSGWELSASVYTYLVPEGRDYAQPTLTADRDWLHLEARYNYESLDTGSAWLGYNLGGDGNLTWELTPMIGGIFGGMYGVAPGYKGSLGFWKLELYSEGEFAYDFDDSSESFFYTWSELTLSPVEGFRFGFVVQRTRAYESDLDVQRGFLVGFHDDHLSLTACVFNPDEEAPTIVVAVGVEF